MPHRELMQHNRVLLVDSITQIDAADAGRWVVSGSHGGSISTHHPAARRTSGGGPAGAAGHRPGGPRQGSRRVAHRHLADGEALLEQGHPERVVQGSGASPYTQFNSNRPHLHYPAS